MPLHNTSRRWILGGLIAAPSLIVVSKIMPIKQMLYFDKAIGQYTEFDPVYISIVRQSMPNLIAYDLCGVQPMSKDISALFAPRIPIELRDKARNVVQTIRKKDDIC
jgi:hypothetical protein